MTISQIVCFMRSIHRNITSGTVFIAFPSVDPGTVPGTDTFDEPFAYSKIIATFVLLPHAT